MTRRQVFWFWGVMDAIVVAFYFLTSVARGRVPYLTDFAQAIWFLEDGGITAFYILGLTVLMVISILVSCLLFFLERDWVKWVVYLQTPVRVVALIPSVSLLHIGAAYVFGPYLVLPVSLVLISEALKVWSVWRWSKACQPEPQP